MYQSLKMIKNKDPPREMFDLSSTLVSFVLSRTFKLLSQIVDRPNPPWDLYRSKKDPTLFDGLGS